MLGPAGQKLVEGLQALGQALAVVEPVDADDQRAAGEAVAEPRRLGLRAAISPPCSAKASVSMPMGKAASRGWPFMTSATPFSSIRPPASSVM